MGNVLQDFLAQALERAWGVSMTSVSAYQPHLALLVSSQKHSTYFDNVHAFTLFYFHATEEICRETVQPEADFYPRFRLEEYDYCSPLTEEQVETITCTSEDEAHSYEPCTSPGSSPIRSPSNSPIV